MGSDGFVKQDRVMRLLRELVLFKAVPHGLTTRELGERMGISQRSAQRDIIALEAELEVPFVQIGSRWQVMDGYWLPPLNFSLHEAVALLLSARLMSRYSDRLNPWAIAAYEKIAAVLPAPLKGPLMETTAGLATRPQDAQYAKILAGLASAWAERRKVVITYAKDRALERKVWPLFLEPSAGGHSCYLLAWDEQKRGVRAFRVERILTMQALEDRFDPPLGFSVTDYLANSWTIWGGNRPVDVELLFSPEVADRLTETTWHPSQKVRRQSDGSVEMSLLVADTSEISHWVLGWGAKCIVLAPARFRDEIAEEARAMAQRYGATGDASRQRDIGPLQDAMRLPRMNTVRRQRAGGRRSAEISG